MRKWKVRDAKARFSGLLRDVVHAGPQQIISHGGAVGVMLSTETYDRLRGPKPSLVAFLRASPLMGVELDLQRDRSVPRNTKP